MKKPKRIYCIVKSCMRRLEKGRVECCKAGNHGWPT